MKTLAIISFLLIVFIDCKAQVIKITNKPSNLGYFKISQNDVVWSENISKTTKPDIHMMFYKGSTRVTKDIGEGVAFSYDFDISNGNVVFSGGGSSYGKIMYFNGSSTSVFASEGFNPAISGDRIAFHAYSSSLGNHIRLYTNASYVSTPTSGGTPWPIDLDQNKLVWYNVGSPGVLKIFDGLTAKVIPLSDISNMNCFQISDNKIIFIDKGNITGAEKLFYYNGTTTIQLNKNRIAIPQISYFNGYAGLDGNKVVWLEKPENINFIGSGAEVWYFDGSSKRLLASSSDPDTYFCTPSISGNNIVWLKKDEHSLPAGFSLGFYNISTAKLKYLDICPACRGINPADHILRLSGNYVAWETYFNSITDIYMADITTLPELSFTGVNDLHSNDIQISQEPSTSKVNISMSNGNLNEYKFKVTNTLGQLVHLENNSGFSGSSSLTLDMSGLPVGIYIFNFSNGKNSVSKKILLTN